MRMKKMIILALVFIVVAAGVSQWLSGGIFQNSEPLAIVKPVRHAAVQAVYATGTVEPSVMIPIAPRSSARLMALLADEGEQVSKGMVLAQLEDSDLKNTLTELQAKADFATKELGRRQSLFKRKATSEQDVDEAQAAYDQTVAAVERTKAELSYLQLVAPEAGVIIRRDGEVGTVIGANTPVFWMSCCKPLRISVEVDEEDIRLIKVDQEVLISADAFPGKIFNGKVMSITPKGDPVARSYRVRISLEQNTPLMIGMTAEANIVTRKTDNALMVPASAVKKGKIWVVRERKLQNLSVDAGAKTDDATEIISGIDEGDYVVMSPTADLTEGETIDTKTKDWKPQ